MIDSMEITNATKEALLLQKQIFDERDRLVEKAKRTLFNNQECYVAQWILQNPDANMSDYELHFRWNDANGYNVYMEKRGE